MMIADMVEQMMKRGVDRDVILLAIRTAEAGLIRRQSAEHPVDESAERRRAYDRERQRRLREIRRQSADNPPIVAPPLTLSSSQQGKPIEEAKKVRARKSPAHPLSADFQPKESHFAAAERLKVPREAVFEKAEDMRIWARSSGAVKADWDATLHGFLRRDADKLRGKSNGQDSVLAAADRLVERIREFDAPAPPEPCRLRGGTGAVVIRAIPEGRSERPGDLCGDDRRDPLGLSDGNNSVRDGPEDGDRRKSVG